MDKVSGRLTVFFKEAFWMLSGKLNDALSGRLIYADFGFPQG